MAHNRWYIKADSEAYNLDTFDKIEKKTVNMPQGDDRYYVMGTRAGVAMPVTLYESTVLDDRDAEWDKIMVELTFR